MNENINQDYSWLARFFEAGWQDVIIRDNEFVFGVCYNQNGEVFVKSKAVNLKQIREATFIESIIPKPEEEARPLRIKNNASSKEAKQLRANVGKQMLEFPLTNSEKNL